MGPGRPRGSKVRDIESPFLSFEETCSYLLINPVTLYKLINRKIVPGVKIGGKWKIRKDLLDKWIHENTTTTEKE